MKKQRLLLKICFIVGCLAMLMSVGDYLALHDIWHDYVSKKVVESYGGNLLMLPDWSETRNEWKVFNISYLIRISYFILSLATLIILLRNQRKESSNEKNTAV